VSAHTVKHGIVLHQTEMENILHYRFTLPQNNHIIKSL